MNEKIVEFIKEEVKRQGKGPKEVIWMQEAWENAIANKKKGTELSEDLIMLWGHLVERLKNSYKRWRRHNVFVVKYDGDEETVEAECPSPHQVPYLMEEWIKDSREELSPEAAYLKFEKIHPFMDGNGRVGKIIYNWLKNTLENPEWPPDFFGGITNP